MLGLPLVTLVLWLMARAGSLWWLYAWFAWVGFQALLLALYPTVIAPLFNKFRPLADVDAQGARGAPCSRDAGSRPRACS